MALVKFFRGLKANYKGAEGQAHRDSIYFATDTNELLLNEAAYGLSKGDLAKLNTAVDTIDWYIDKNTVYIKATNIGKKEEKYTSIPLAADDHAGLMSMGHFSGLTTLMGNADTTGSVAKQVADAKSELIGNANTDTAASNTITGAKKHADALNTAMDTRVDALEAAVGKGGSIATQITEAINKLDVAEIGGTGKVITTVSETDGKIAATAIDLTAASVAATATEASNNAVAVTGTNVAAQIASLATSIKTVSKDAKSYSVKKLTPEEVTALSDSNVREAYQLLDEDSKVSGETIKIYKDSSLKKVALNGQTLNFTYILADGTESTVGVDVSAFLAESEFGDGLEVVNHIAKIKKDDTSEAFLTVGAKGVKLSGVQDAINTAKTNLIDNATEGYNTLGKLEDKIKEVDTKVSSAHTVVNAKADGHVIVTVAKSSDNTHDVVTVTEDGDIASANALTNEIAHRKAVTGIEGDTYVAHNDNEIISGASNLDDADVKLATKLKAVSDAVDTINGDKTFVKSLTVNNVPADIANNAATVTIDGADIKLDGYTKASDGGELAPTDTVNAALSKLEYMLSWHEAN